MKLRARQLNVYSFFLLATKTIYSSVGVTVTKLMLPVSLAFIAAALLWSSLKYNIVFRSETNHFWSVAWSIVVIVPIGAAFGSLLLFSDPTVYLVSSCPVIVFR